MSTEPGPEKRKIDDQILRDLRAWEVTGELLRWTHYILGVVAIITSGICTVVFSKKTDPPVQASDFSIACSVANFFCTGIVTFIKPDRLGRAYRKAASRLHVACIVYRNNPKRTKAEFLKDYTDAASMKNSPDAEPRVD